MPNHIINCITFTNPSEDRIKEVLAFVKSEEQEFDFNKIIPRPESLNITSGGFVDEAMAHIKNDRGFFEKMLEYEFVKKAGITTVDEVIKYSMDRRMTEEVLEEGRKAIYNLEHYGCQDWYLWSITYWGTKWNAYDIIEETEDYNITFQTAWSTPEPIFKKLSELFPDVEITIEYADEDIGQNCGRYVYSNGVLTEDWTPNVDEATAFANGLWGYEGEEEERDDSDEYISYFE